MMPFRKVGGIVRILFGQKHRAQYAYGRGSLYRNLASGNWGIADHPYRAE
jgi:hypothetical protein